MSLSGIYLFSEGLWKDLDPASPDILDEGGEPWMAIIINEGAVAMVRYRPAGSGKGYFYIGYSPDDYYGFTDRSGPGDVGAEADGLTQWWALVHRDATSKQRMLTHQALLDLLVTQEDAAAVGPDNDNNDEGWEEADDFRDAPALVHQLLTILNLPPPDDLP